jgi:ABC-type nitrate/sulfonate/bicarbonate transport system permease component
MSKERKGFAVLKRILPTLVIVAFLGAWQLFVTLRGIQPVYLPAPSAIVVAMYRMAADGSLFVNLGATLLRIFSGFLLATVTGISLGLMMGMSPLFQRIIDPWIAALYPLPKIALIPLLVIWLGTGESYKVLISAITAFFPIVLSTYAGVCMVDRGLMKAAQDLGASRRQVQLNVVIPSAVPTIFAGLQLGMGVTIIMVIAAEMIGGSSEGGMGYVLINAGQILETETVFAALVVLALMGAAIMKLQEWIGNRLVPWSQIR